MKPHTTRPARQAKTTAPGATPPPLPDFALIPARPFPKEAIKDPVRCYSLGLIVPPAEQARAKHADAPTHRISPPARQALAALTGSGPRQTPPHSDTAELLGEALARLRDHARDGDADAFATLGQLLREAVADFHVVAQQRPVLAAAWGRNQNSLPANAGRNTAHTDDLETALNLFTLGEASPYRVNPIKKRGGKAPDFNTDVNALAALLCRHLADHRALAGLLRPPVPKWARLAANLPELNHRTADVWNSAAWELLASSVENERELAAICLLGKVRAADTKGNGVGPQIASIQTRLLRAFETIAAKKPPA